MPSLLKPPKLWNHHASSNSSDNNNPPTADDPRSSAGMSSAFVSKSRRVRFDLTLKIIDLNNVPLVSGTSFIKWHLPSSTAAEHRGRTEKCAIRDHRVAYDYEKRIPVRLTVGKDGMLQECSVDFEILQEYGAGGRGERIRLGDVKLNLAEYVEASETPASPGAAGPGQGEEGVVRRYLMQESKINSTLKLGIHMRHVEGTRDFYAPPLRTAPVFGGIAGIIHSSEPAATAQRMNVSGGVDAAGASPELGAEGQDMAVPNLSSRNKEVGEMQDMYRRTLAAFWASQPGELRADECIEDIFAGGDGWGKNGRPEIPAGKAERKEGTAGFGRRNSRDRSGTSTPNPQDGSGGEAPKMAQGGGRGIMGRHHHKHGKNKNMTRKQHGEVEEQDCREDLISWRIGEAAYA
ncbi:uncharacterized protein LTR77_002603 [Saxophila tyrrhenica]|uniref:C2 NT-type domain-containing protein n=1 Tax=Saxophila tyrrhenica TaxID=1690608 RepID=A0AAV9PLP5_9PEZI|nr:hypothetical protein LTR77_002603 [Saxophila tyrrhenica]